MSGSEGFEAYLDGIEERVDAAIPDAAFKAMEHLREVAVSRTPLESGDLRAGASTVNAIDKSGASVYYPGPYARYQEYEILRHEVGQRLYLTSAVETETPKVLEILGQEIHKAMQ
ncbi:HK97 gp10 family phage protein [Arthrobacter sp. M4]|uniref:HK97 gp10 family phage protein n=1 Tax=Arthrobacter sp. M4 TaxID=218160 RepID=UPI001CDBA1DF|nr:HK97 gp10 family phage protein [Arthrobacter sp. M4]MCA4132942.1 HK97 gp10 family phage protein [Arthrobacter sp. M4]